MMHTTPPLFRRRLARSAPALCLATALGIVVMPCALALAAVGRALPTTDALSTNGAANANGRLIVLGFDGADARTVQALMDEGQLPHLDRLRKEGTFAPLSTTTPAESPVSWAALNSGQNPGKTGVPGFVKRELRGEAPPAPGPGHIAHEARDTTSFELSALNRLLASNSPAMVSAIAGGALLVAFIVIFALLLRIRKGVALALAVVIAALGAWAGFVTAGYVPRQIDDVVGNPSHAGGFWEVAARAGVKCVVLDGAMAWDRPAVEGVQVLAGLGVPDVRSANCDWFVYTTDTTHDGFPILSAPDGRTTNTGGRLFHVDEQDGRIESWIYGPVNFWAIDKLRQEWSSIHEQIAGTIAQSTEADALKDELAKIHGSKSAWREKLSREIEALEKSPAVTEAVDRRPRNLMERLREIQRTDLPAVDAGSQSEEGRMSVRLAVEKRPDGKARVSLGSQTQELSEGEWSRWYSISFDMNPLIKVRAVTRAKLMHMSDPFELYVDVLQLDPSAAPYWQPISQPASFAEVLAKSIGTTYETVGWACMTMPFKDREIDPKTFLEDIEFTNGWREKLLLASLKRSDWRVLMNVESTPDRVQHMMYQFYDTGHPNYALEKAREKTTYFGHEIELADAIPATYREIDRLVGEVMDQHLASGDTLLICSDHGFQSFRWGVNLNNWLVDHGYLVLRDGVTSADNNYLYFVDWEKTRAYALGLGMVFLNLAGREPHGIVKPEDASALMDEISAEMMKTVDPATLMKPVRSVARSDKIHKGDYIGLEADLMPGFEAGYRVGWITTLGGMRLVQSEDKEHWVSGRTFERNTNNWSGDHVSVSEDLVRGVFFSNRKVEIPEGGVNLLHIAPTALSVVGVGVPGEYDMPPLRFVD